MELSEKMKRYKKDRKAIIKLMDMIAKRPNVISTVSFTVNNRGTFSYSAAVHAETMGLNGVMLLGFNENEDMEAIATTLYDSYKRKYKNCNDDNY